MNTPAKPAAGHKLPFEAPWFLGNWTPVYWEPMLGSGERITAAIVAFGSDGTHRVKLTVPESMLRALYGARAGGVLKFLSDLENSLEEWAKEHSSLAKWTPPLSGFIRGESQDGRARDIDGLVDQGVMMSASLGTLRATSSPEIRAEVAADAWATEIRQEVNRLTPVWKNSFDRTIQLGSEDLKIRIGFVADKYAAQFGVLRSDPSRISRDILVLKSRIVDLGQLKGDLFPYTENRELIVGHSDIKEPSVRAKDRMRIQRKLDLIEREADTFGIRLRGVTSAGAAAQIITEKAA